MLGRELQGAQDALSFSVADQIDPGFALMVSCQTKTARFEKTFVHGAIHRTTRAPALEEQ
jgi:hypothetical protein